MDWLDFDLDKTLKDFEYTRKAVLEVNNILDSEYYETKDAQLIYEYLLDNSKELSFKDYLKRYIYNMAEIEEEFLEIEDEEYKEILKISFKERNAPYFFKPTTRKTGKILNDFIVSDHVKRETIFVLGFGLGMNDLEVCEFLTKVNLESSIDFTNYEEVIYWFCFRYDYKYAYAKKMISMYESMEADDSLSSEIWRELYRSPKLFITTESELIHYLKYLKTFRAGNRKDDGIFAEFKLLYQRASNAVANEYNKNEEAKKHYKASDIGPSDFEKILCSGIPVGENGNLVKMSNSTLSGRFANKRMGRQRITSILQRKHVVERFDLIGFLFLIYALEVESDWPAERYLKYIEEINKILSKCDMEGIYPANPYEAFVLMCLMNDDPLVVYSDVLEKSFEECIMN